MFWWICLLALHAVARAYTVDVSVHANWTDAPFVVQLVEAGGDTLYHHTVQLIYGEAEDVEIDEIDETDDTAEDTETHLASDSAVYSRVTKGLSETDAALFNLNLVNKVHSPRVQAHYDHYADIEGTLAEKVAKQCAKDSFGQTLDDPLRSWVLYGLEVYCSEQDLFAIRTDSTASGELLPFDRVIGDNADAPLLVLYGDPTTERFAPMLSTLLLFAESGQFRVVWRYVPPESTERALLAGYGAQLTAKNKKNQPLRPQKYANAAALMEKAQHGEILDVAETDLPKVALMLASMVLQEDNSDRVELLSKLLNNLPLYAPYLARTKDQKNLETVHVNAEKNEAKGASGDMVGISINGAMLHRLDTDFPHLLSALERELAIMDEIKKLGFSTAQTKLILSKFALMAAYHENEFRNGESSNRYAVYKDEFLVDDPTSGGVVFFNNLEKDQVYDLYSRDREEIYLTNAGKVRQGQVPPLKENVHDLIFVVNFSNKNQLKVFFAMSKLVLDKGISQQLGLIPLVENEKDKMMADMFYHILQVGEPTEALAFLYKYYESTEDDEEKELFAKVKLPKDRDFPFYNRTLAKYSLNEPSVIINGVIKNLRSLNWQTQMGNQITHDVIHLQQLLKQGVHESQPLKDLLFEHAANERNSRVIPRDPSNVRYKKISKDLIGNSVAFKKRGSGGEYPVTFWLIGDFNSQTIWTQFKILLDFIKTKRSSLKIRVINTSQDNVLLDSLEKIAGDKSLTDSVIDELIETVGDFRIASISKSDPAKISLLERNSIQARQPTLLFNSRFIRLDTLVEIRDLELLDEYEHDQRLGIFKEITDTYPKMFSSKPILFHRKGKLDDSDWFDLLSSAVTNSFYLEDSLVRSDVPRFDFSSLNFENAIDLTGYSKKRVLDVLVVVDPVDPLAQKLVAMAQTLSKLPFVNALILLQPFSKVQTPTKIDKFYASGFADPVPQFAEDGKFVEPKPDVLENIPKGRFIVQVDAPIAWHVVKGSASSVLNLDNLVVDQNIEASFTLSKIVVEGFVRDIFTAKSIPGLTLQAVKDGLTREGYTLQPMGYNQLRLEPGAWTLLLKTDSASEQFYNLLSASENKYDANTVPTSLISLDVFSLYGKLIHPRVVQKGDGNAFTEIKKSSSKAKPDINIFSIASGHTYETLLAMMILSVEEHTNKLVKFWLLEDYLSERFVQQLPLLAKEYGFEYELVSYKWPVWLRQQTELRRTVWGYKILFLDVLFPTDVSKIIFVDADQIARTDLQELVDTDLHGAAYGFAPMCESRTEMEGFRFWKQGYWKKVLGEDLKYHISALFVVDLDNFRENGIGEKLRSHYQKLSSDPGSLANLDQDLPNNMQRQVPIYTLPQEWLWCETWCSGELKKQAKMIDLCNNPTSLEGKLERAKRLIPEWESYNQKLQKLGEGDLGTFHDEL